MSQTTKPVSATEYCTDNKLLSAIEYLKHQKLQTNLSADLDDLLFFSTLAFLYPAVMLIQSCIDEIKAINCCLLTSNNNYLHGHFFL